MVVSMYVYFMLDTHIFNLYNLCVQVLIKLELVWPLSFCMPVRSTLACIEA